MLINRKVRIIYFIESIEKGGKERQLIEIAKSFSCKENFEVYIIAFSNRIEYEEINNYNLKIKIISKNPIKILNQLIREFRTIKPDIVHSWGIINTFYSTLMKVIFNFKLLDGSIRYAGKPRFLSLQNILSRTNFLFSDIVIANSNAGLNAFNKNINKKYRVINNGIDLKRFDKQYLSLKEITQKDNKSDGIIGIVANFTHAKDHKTIINTAIEVLNNLNLLFVFIGDGLTKSEMQSLIPKDKYNNFIFLGKRNDVDKIIPLFNFGIMLSNYDKGKHAEGISNAIMEQMALGIPVIATNTGGNKELIENNIDGFLIDPYDNKTLYRIIFELILDSGKRNKIGLNAKNKIINQFLLDKMINNYKNIYKELIINNT